MEKQVYDKEQRLNKCEQLTSDIESFIIKPIIQLIAKAEQNLNDLEVDSQSPLHLEIMALDNELCDLNSLTDVCDQIIEEELDTETVLQISKKVSELVFPAFNRTYQCAVNRFDLICDMLIDEAEKAASYEPITDPYDLIFDQITQNTMEHLSEFEVETQPPPVFH